MGLPERITFLDDRYPYIALTPVGKKNKSIRSIGHKFERGILSRLNEAVSAHSLDVDWTNVRQFLNLSGQAVLPLGFQKDETIYPYLLRPEAFLWTELSEEHGFPFVKSWFYDRDLTQLSADELDEHIGQVLEEYRFLADISLHPESYWRKKMVKAFHDEPFVQFLHKNKRVVEAVEKMNQSALLSVLKFPEDIAHWRKRVEIIMRPYRMLPATWLTTKEEGCSHEYEVRFDARTWTIEWTCEECHFQLDYLVKEDQIRYKEYFDPDLAKKRIHTIHQQFNDMAMKNSRLLEQLSAMQEVLRRLKPANTILEECFTLASLITKYQGAPWSREAYPLLDMYERVKDMTIPKQNDQSILIWFSDIVIQDVTVLKEVQLLKNMLPANVYPMAVHLKHQLQDLLEEVRYHDDDIIMTIKGRELTFAHAQQVLDLIYYYGTEHPAHTLVQVLAGKATNKIRTLKLHETRWFGLLADWPEKYIQKLFHQLEKEGWLHKQQKGYSVGHLADEVM